MRFHGVSRGTVISWDYRGLLPALIRTPAVTLYDAATVRAFVPPSRRVTDALPGLSAREAAERRSVTVQTIYYWHAYGLRPYQDEHGRKFYDPAEVDAFVAPSLRPRERKPRAPNKRREPDPSVLPRYAGFYTREEAARYHGVSIFTVQDWISRGELKSTNRAGRTLLYPIADVQRIPARSIRWWRDRPGPATPSEPE